MSRKAIIPAATQAKLASMTTAELRELCEELKRRIAEAEASEAAPAKRKPPRKARHRPKG